VKRLEAESLATDTLHRQLHSRSATLRSLVGSGLVCGPGARRATSPPAGGIRHGSLVSALLTAATPTLAGQVVDQITENAA
jgi:hypothetical protein